MTAAAHKIAAKETTIRISEIFGPTIQGEGLLIGLPTVFVRTGGCDYRCSWCDTLHAVDSEYRDTWKPMPVEAIWQEVRRLSGGVPLTVSLSGGNPAIQPLGVLIAKGQGEGYRFALETQGSIAKDWFADLDHLVLSPKPPSSGMETDWQAFEDCSTMRIMPMPRRHPRVSRICRSISSPATTPRRRRMTTMRVWISMG
jgi:7-carboxy-7-deazaguanine synthase